MYNPESSDSPQIKLFARMGLGIRKKGPGKFLEGHAQGFLPCHLPRSLNGPEETEEGWLKRAAWVMSLRTH